MRPAAVSVPKPVTKPLSRPASTWPRRRWARAPVLPTTCREICTVGSNATLTSQLGLVMVSELEVRPVMVPVATARLPGDGVGAPGLGHTAAPPRPPPRPAPATLPPRVFWVVWPVVFALTLLCPIL